MRFSWFFAAVLLAIIFADWNMNIAATTSKDGFGGASDMVILAARSDPYYDLAEEIAHSENLPLTHSLKDALKHKPIFLLWVITPEHLSDSVFSQFGQTLQKHRAVISIGILTGSSQEKARSLWQRRLFNGKSLAVIPREHKIFLHEKEQTTSILLNKNNVVASLQEAAYVTFQGHGSRRHWLLEDGIDLIADDIPPLPPLLVNALACQTLKVWNQESIALRVLDQGAAAYAGFVYSPLAYAFGEPKGFPFSYTWPDFPIGHVVQVQNQGYLQGFLAWPFYFLLGDPRLSFLADMPYQLIDEYENSTGRVLTYSNAPKGVIPVYIRNGARYRFVEIPGVGAAWDHALFYNQYVQQINLGSDKYLLFLHQGGDFTIKLSKNLPWKQQFITPILSALDHTTVLYFAESNFLPGLIGSGLMLLISGWFAARRQMDIRQYLPDALVVGLALTLFRGGYAVMRQEHLHALYTNRIRTMDAAFDINIWFLFSSLLMAACGAWLFFNSCSRWKKMVTVLIIIFPSWMIAGFSAGIPMFINMLAKQKYGIALYAYGQGIMALMTCIVELFVVTIILFILSVQYINDCFYP
ncbi:hypothetical protein U27_01799 [Candidatus Vecturithrix granuli]|uniref:Gingipain domain-containing protein n=1 Tax=Vecturithrix granuli TaxID=1499967 RepID=A0A0S6W5S8_VECG1|nr:hypothetical protein U27_01799 [Candidatus Vecturithrix granuli]